MPAYSNNQTTNGSIAVVARDDTGGCLGASAVVLLGKTDVETPEALACRGAVALARDIGAWKFRVTRDNKNVDTNLEQGTMGLYGHIVREIRESVEDFVTLAFVHERRISNKEAHKLAKSSVPMLGC
jgi:hypothetical protein